MKKFFISQKFVEEQIKLNEILDKYIHIDVTKKTEKLYTATFTVPAMQGLNDTGHDIKYNVSLSQHSTPTLCEINNEDGKGWINCKAAGLAFSNDSSNMNQLSHRDEESNSMVGVNAALVFSTVVKAVDVYVQRFKPLCINFYPYHAGLTNSYIILCKVGARQFKYVWGNPNTVMANRSGTPQFYLFHKDLYDKWLANRVKKQ